MESQLEHYDKRYVICLYERLFVCLFVCLLVCLLGSPFYDLTTALIETILRHLKLIALSQAICQIPIDW